MDKEIVAKVFQHSEALGRIGRMDQGRGQALRSKMACAGDEGLNPASRQPRHGIIAQIDPFGGGGIRRAGLGFEGWRLIHQDQAIPEALAYSKDLQEYDPLSRGAHDVKLCCQAVERLINTETIGAVSA
jgi:hypothetical protein